MSSAISPETIGTCPQYGSLSPMSLTTLSVPLEPTAPLTSSLPLSLSGSSTTGFCTYALTFPMLSETHISAPVGPSPSIFTVIESSLPLSPNPMSEVPIASLPSAAVTTAEVLCISSMRETISFPSIALHTTEASLLITLTILPIKSPSVYSPAHIKNSLRFIINWRVLKSVILSYKLKII